MRDIARDVTLDSISCVQTAGPMIQQAWPRHLAEGSPHKSGQLDTMPCLAVLACLAHPEKPTGSFDAFDSMHSMHSKHRIAES